MPTTEQKTPKKRLVIQETAIREIEVSDSTLSDDVAFEIAPNPNISNE